MKKLLILISVITTFTGSIVWANANYNVITINSESTGRDIRVVSFVEDGKSVDLAYLSDDGSYIIVRGKQIPVQKNSYSTFEGHDVSGYSRMAKLNEKIVYFF